LDQHQQHGEADPALDRSSALVGQQVAPSQRDKPGIRRMPTASEATNRAPSEDFGGIGAPQPTGRQKGRDQPTSAA